MLKWNATEPANPVMREANSGTNRASKTKFKLIRTNTYTTKSEIKEN